MVYSRDEATIERFFSHLRLIAGPRASHITALALERRLVVRLVKGDWTTVDLRTAYNIMQRTRMRMLRKVRKVRCDKGKVRRALAVPVEIDPGIYYELFIDEPDEQFVVGDEPEADGGEAGAEPPRAA